MKSTPGSIIREEMKRKKRAAMKKRTALIVGFCGLALVLNAGGFFSFLQKDIRVRYDPVAYEDGSVEYRLVAKGEDRVRGTGDDEHWVMRVPPGVYVRTTEKVRDPEDKGIDPPFMYNYSIAFQFTWPEFGYLADHRTVERNKSLDVSLTARKVDYGTGSYDTSFGARNFDFSAGFDQNTNYRCRLDQEIAPGVFTLREPTNAEMEEMHRDLGENEQRARPLVPGYDGGCYTATFDELQYAIYDDDGGPIGAGRCSYLLDERGDGQCSTRFWLPQNRVVSVSFHEDNLLKATDIYARVTAFFDEITDQEKSINMFSTEGASQAFGQ